MADIVELERRVTALEVEMKAERRDTLRMLGLQMDTLTQLEELNRRVAANELTAIANARTTEAGFANVQAQINALDAKVEVEIGQVRAEIGQVRAEVRQVKADVASLRHDLPGMLVDAIRESRGPVGEGA